MHIPDGFLAPPVFLALDALAIPAVGWLARRTSIEPSPAGSHEATARVPLLGVMGAFIFAAQMINVPLGLGVSGHLLGGTLLATMAGPAQATVVMTAVLILQALLFQDGGVLALGANICNMAIAGVFAGALPLWLWGRRAWTLFLGGILSVVVSGAGALAQLGLSGVSLPPAILTAGLVVFLAAGLLEGAITVATVRAIERLSPGSFPAQDPAAGSRTRLVFVVCALLLVTIGTGLASDAPDGLMHLAEQLHLSEQPVWDAPFADYAFSLKPASDVGSTEQAAAAPIATWASKPLAGLTGLASAYLLCAFALKRR